MLCFSRCLRGIYILNNDDQDGLNRPISLMLQSLLRILDRITKIKVSFTLAGSACRSANLD